MVSAPAVRSQPPRHLEDFRKRCLCLALGLQMVSLRSGLGTADLSQCPEPRSPCGESRHPHHWALRGATRITLVFCMKPLPDMAW